MNEAEATAVLDGILSGLAIQRGSTVFLGIDMSKLPLPKYDVVLSREQMKERADKLCRFVFTRLMDKLGPDGTLIVPTYTYSCGNPANPFIVEESRSEIGPFTEWVRKQPGALRSIHPVFSVAAIGPKAAEITRYTGGSSFGPLSPFGRLTSLGTRFVSLGVTFRCSVTYVHHLEQCHGCNHRHHKVMSTPVFYKGEKLPGPFHTYVRWRGTSVTPDLARLQQRLLDEGSLTEILWNGCVNHAVDVDAVDRVGYAMLAENPCAFASRNLQVNLDESAVATSPSGEEVVNFTLAFG